MYIRFGLVYQLDLVVHPNDLNMPPINHIYIMSFKMPKACQRQLLQNVFLETSEVKGDTDIQHVIYSNYSRI